MHACQSSPIHRSSERSFILLRDYQKMGGFMPLRIRTREVRSSSNRERGRCFQSTRLRTCHRPRAHPAATRGERMSSPWWNRRLPHAPVGARRASTAARSVSSGVCMASSSRGSMCVQSAAVAVLRRSEWTASLFGTTWSQGSLRRRRFRQFVCPKPAFGRKYCYSLPHVTRLNAPF